MCIRFGNLYWTNPIYKNIEIKKIICKMCGITRSHRLAVRTSDSHSGNMGSIPIGTAIKIKFGFTEFYFYLVGPGIEHMKHGIRTAAKRQTEVCRSPEVLTKGDFARWRSIPIGTAKCFKHHKSGVFC